MKAPISAHYTLHIYLYIHKIKKKGKEKKKIQPQKRGRSPAAAAIQIRNYSEAKATLSCLPKDTPAFEYESASQMEAAARSVDDGGGGYCAFHDAESFILLDTRQKGTKKRRFFPTSRILIAKR
ncbi:hypothetical protein TESG_08378 [Trichophyton tonsurans CBS 112818]|uniref:Uncharacterized protein n=1 Tax=Trichophyton tonsurans (strain CBS 112818) TaxID=647933 RepID=F2RVN3_TRIT1|nr:hypothetical protein TESG_08378 [Trichophyton tonsurans CBS 112818]